MTDKNPCMKGGEGPRVVFMMLQQRSRVANGIPNMLHHLIIHSTHHTENTLLSNTIFEGKEEPSRSHQ